jgi:hypothetical protein
MASHWPPEEPIRLAGRTPLGGGRSTQDILAEDPFTEDSRKAGAYVAAPLSRTVLQGAISVPKSCMGYSPLFSAGSCLAVLTRPPKCGGSVALSSVFMNLEVRESTYPAGGCVDRAGGLSYNQWQADYPLVAPANPLLQANRDKQAEHPTGVQRAEEGAGIFPPVPCRA